MTAMLLLLSGAALPSTASGDDIPTVVLAPNDALEIELPAGELRAVHLVAAQAFRLAWISTYAQTPGAWGNIIATIHPQDGFVASIQECGTAPADWSTVWTTTGSNIDPETPMHPAGSYTLLIAAELPAGAHLYFDDLLPGALSYFIGHASRPVETAASSHEVRFIAAEVTEEDGAPVTSEFDEAVTLERPALGLARYSAFPALGAGTAQIETRFGGESTCDEAQAEGVLLGAQVAGIGQSAGLGFTAGAGEYVWSGAFEGTFGSWTGVFDFSSAARMGLIVAAAGAPTD